MRRPSESISMRASRMCSVPMYSCLCSAAFSFANRIVLRARSVKRSYMIVFLKQGGYVKGRKTNEFIVFFVGGVNARLPQTLAAICAILCLWQQGHHTSDRGCVRGGCLVWRCWI